MGDLRNVAFGTGGAFCLTQAAFVNNERFTNGLFRSRMRFLFNTACFRKQPPALGKAPFVYKMLFLVTNSVFRKQRAVYEMWLSEQDALFV